MVISTSSPIIIDSSFCLLKTNTFGSFSCRLLGLIRRVYHPDTSQHNNISSLETQYQPLQLGITQNPLPQTAAFMFSAISQGVSNRFSSLFSPKEQL
jgi:hypothetical protein